MVTYGYLLSTEKWIRKLSVCWFIYILVLSFPVFAKSTDWKLDSSVQVIKAHNSGNGADPHSPLNGLDAGDYSQTTFYVSTKGSDQWSGTLPEGTPSGNDGPFATLMHARNAIRALRKQRAHGPFAIVVRAGTYRLREPFLLDSEDSGTDKYPFIIKAYPNERPVLSGDIHISNFKPYKGSIFKAHVTGIQSSFLPRQLYDRDQRKILARYPNIESGDPIHSGFLYVDRLASEGDKGKFKYKPGTVHEWGNVADGEVVIFPGYNYTNAIIKGFAIDKANELIVLSRDAGYDIKRYNRYFFQNLMEELDTPGEWFFDRKKGDLYYWPSGDDNLASVTIPYLKNLIEIKPKNRWNIKIEAPSNIRFEGFDLQGAQGAAISVLGARNIDILSHRIFNVGGDGIDIQDGANILVSGNDIYQVSGSGIRISGGDARTLTASQNQVVNNYIHHIGIDIKYSSGIDCSGVGNLISHNLIHSLPRIGVWFDGNDHIIEYNHIHHVNLETQDSGIIYASPIDWTKRGSVLRYNYLHHSGGLGISDATGEWRSFSGTWGLRLDDWTSGTIIFGNIFANTSEGGVGIHGGRDNIIENNIFVEGGGRLGQVVYTSWLPSEPASKKWLPIMYKKLSEGNLSKYPELASITNVDVGAKMSGNRFLRNIVYYRQKDASLFGVIHDIDLASTVSDYNVIYHEGLPLLIPYTRVDASKQWDVWRKMKMDQHTVIADPMIVDIDNGNFALAKDSPALKLGFKPIPFDKIGLYPDPWRATWPVK